jgi:tRNA dimethylallyltransferase
LGIVGPTATGKSAIAHEVARTLGDIEIVTVDSMQVYVGMDLGTAKPTPTMRAEVPHHLLDVADPGDEFTLRAFQVAAQDAIADIESRQHRPLLVGGTGLYLRAIVDELDIPARYPDVRARIEARDDLAGLYTELQERDPVAAARIEPGNRRRIVRALEVCEGSGRPFSSYGEGLDTYPAIDWDLVALDVDAAELNARIEQRYRDQLDAGFLDEVRRLTSRERPLGRTAAQALGYRQFAAHLAGECTLSEALADAVTATRRFARRQRSWFRRDPRLVWCDVTGAEHASAVIDRLVERWRSA